jgi:hypothetical protein
MPKCSSQAQLIEGKPNRLRLREETPLSEEEVAAVDDGVAAVDKLLESLADVPTPSGQTPRQIHAELLPVAAVREASGSD